MERLKLDECQNCERWKGYVTDCFENCMKPFEALEEFNEYKVLEEQGLLLRLPCKVGDTVYITDGSSLNVKEIHIQDNLVKYFVARFNPNGMDVRFPFDNIGKTVFLTQAEAEEALKRMEG